MEIRDSQFYRGYIFDRREIEAAHSPEYLAFLKEAGIADLEKTPNLFVSRHLLKIDKKVEDALSSSNIKNKYSEDETITGISQPNARSLIYGLGGIVLPTALMYRLFIPNIKDEALRSGSLARETLSEMVENYAEWLEDLVLDRTILKVGTKERKLSFPNRNGFFDRTDISEYGYPTNLRDQGEFYHWHVDGDEMAAFRSMSSELYLGLNWEPSFEDDKLGVRFAKFF